MFSAAFEDSEQMLAKCAEHDLRCMDLLSLCKNPLDRIDGVRFIQRQIRELRDVFVHVSSESKESGGIDIETITKFVIDVWKVPHITRL